jgi:hypothetical protein
MTKPAVGASFSQEQQGAATHETFPEVDMTSTTGSGVPEVLPMGDATSVGGGAATTGDGKGNIDELKVIMGHPGLRALGHVFFLRRWVRVISHYARRRTYCVTP